MSCTNPNCNEGCGCNNCCPPVTPPTPPVPPTCEGTKCEEIYDAACVNYTGPAITCFSIPTNTNLNTVIQTIATNICACCSKSKCISPFKLFFERFKAMYTYMSANEPGVSFYDLFKVYMENGMVIKKCQYCCPDEFVYVLGVGDRSFCGLVNETFSSYNTTAEPPCTNCWTKYNACATTLLTTFDTTFDGEINPITVDDICEYGGMNNISVICDLNSIFADNFTTSQITDIMNVIYQNGLSVTCNLEHGNIVIGDFTVVSSYVSTYMV